jgi:hypothetical protein
MIHILIPPPPRSGLVRAPKSIRSDLAGGGLPDRELQISPMVHQGRKFYGYAPRYCNLADLWVDPRG